ncbi:MAG: hypothetical protein KGJ60_05445 [Verrucomicrobiota bacterium]|nr:hypothetical protein [Verrucomicrobiota bacterium]
MVTTGTVESPQFVWAGLDVENVKTAKTMPQSPAAFESLVLINDAFESS